MNVLFVTMDGGGNVPPMLGVARAVADRGEQVRIVGHECLRREVEHAGLPFLAYPTARPWDSCREQSPLRWVPMFNDANIGADVRQLCERDRPDVAVVDCMLLPALQAVQDAAVPHAVFSHTLRDYLNGAHRLGAGTAAWLYGHRISRLWNSADLNIVATVARLDPESRRPQPDNVRWVGAVVDAREPDRSAGPAQVLVSMSTNGFRGQRRTLARVIEALATLPVDAVVTTGGVVEPAALPSAPNVDVREYADHGELMPACSLLVGHGGHATTFRALAHGIPTLIMPASGLSDQPLIGRAIAAAGAGLTLRRSASVESIRRSIITLLVEPGWADAAAVVGAEIRASNAARRAAQLVTGLA
ncbi:glycosyltransferase [Mycolicibacterium farcinogenes]|uniref:glycosyltransferase n=1 Tax=Mycolicibacterium farcinogenes TaxID=1802 RepID=UPI001C8E074A|nr:nucleotide disphospho-sugar-binding domain-containing protein [Mycolicibacterium farcinogenes]QZH61540.1 glycosyltransferase [Mycolicibacterium farcinogenes]